jgi:hypothetical protein
MKVPMTGRLLILITVLITIWLSAFNLRQLSLKSKVADNPEQDLLQLEKKWLDAEDDPTVLESILADDFVHVLPLGFVTKREQIDYLRSHPTAKRETRHFEGLRVRIFGRAGVVNGIVVATDADGKTRRTLFTDVFAYRRGELQAVNAQELPESKS